MAKKALLIVFKIGLPIAILVYLFWDASKNNAFETLRLQSKNWPLLGLALASCATAVVITLVRWYYLVRALDIPFTLKEAMRFGFLGYLFNLAPMGIVGGDLLKAYMLARHHPSEKTAAVATVFVDRIIGLYTLFVVASVAILLTGFASMGNEWIRWICQFTHWITIVGTVAMVALLMPDLSNGGSTRLLAKTPLIGGVPRKDRPSGGHVPTSLARGSRFRVDERRRSQLLLNRHFSYMLRPVRDGSGSEDALYHRPSERRHGSHPAARRTARRWPQLAVHPSAGHIRHSPSCLDRDSSSPSLTESSPW